MFEVISSVINNGIDPDDVAQLVLDAVRTGGFYILTHPDWAPFVTDRTDRIAAGEAPRLAMLPGAPTDDEG